MKTLVQFYISIPCTNCPSLIFQIEYPNHHYLHTMMFYIYTTNSPIVDDEEDDDKMS